jgi:integrase
MRKKLSEAVIERLPTPSGKDTLEVFDEEQRGLVLRIYASGSKTFWCRYSVGGRKIKFRLGDASTISITAARNAVRKALGELAQGRDPASERKATREQARQKREKDAFTLEKLIATWEKSDPKEEKRRKSYVEEAARAIRVAFASALHHPAAALTDTAVAHVLDGMTAKTPAMAAAVGRNGKSLYNWAIKKRHLTENPFHRQELPTVTKRSRVLDADELALIWKAAEATPNPFGAIVRLLILAGQRRDEVGSMAWSELSDDLLTWTLPAPRAKNRTAHIVPLSALARQIIAGALRREGEDLLFPGEGGVFQGWSHAKARLDNSIHAAREKAAGGKVDPLPNWTLHDLRRTVATNLQALGVRLEVTEAVLNHRSGSRGGIVGVYQQHHWSDEKRAALRAWSEQLTAIVEGRAAADNVHEFKRTSA